MAKNIFKGTTDKSTGEDPDAGQVDASPDSPTMDWRVDAAGEAANPDAEMMELKEDDVGPYDPDSDVDPAEDYPDPISFLHTKAALKQVANLTCDSSDHRFVAINKIANDALGRN